MSVSSSSVAKYGKLTVSLLRGHGSATEPRGSVRLAALRAPLGAKLLGANAFVVIVLAVVWLSTGGVLRWTSLCIIAAMLGVHAVLIVVALRPIRDLENAASRVWYGDFGARVERSVIADHQVLRVGSMFNILLDGLASDRARMRALATEVIAAGDRERAAIAEELQNSTAQNLAALLLQLSVALRDVTEPDLARQLRSARDCAEAVLEEVRLLSSTVHPGVLDDLGLEAALRKLARDSSHGNGIDIDVNVDENIKRLPRNLEAAFYRVAREAVRNAIQHGLPRRIRINLFRQAVAATLEVHDDGRGFDLSAVERRMPGKGFLYMRERVALVDGWLDVKTAEGSGTTVSATVPLEPASDAAHVEMA